MLPGVLEDVRHLGAHLRDVAPELVGDADARVGLQDLALPQGDHLLRHQAREHGVGQVGAHLVHAQLARLTLGVASSHALRREVVVAIAHRDVVEAGHPSVVGGADEGMQRERRGAVAIGEPVDEHLQPRRDHRCGHGRLGLGAVAGGVAGGVEGGAFGVGVEGAGVPGAARTVSGAFAESADARVVQRAVESGVGSR